jgi:hypothetical protein
MYETLSHRKQAENAREFVKMSPRQQRSHLFERIRTEQEWGNTKQKACQASCLGLTVAVGLVLFRGLVLAILSHFGGSGTSMVTSLPGGGCADILHAFTSREIEARDFQTTQTYIHEFMVDHPREQCVTANAVGSYRALVSVRVAEATNTSGSKLGTVLDFVNPRVWLSAEREDLLEVPTSEHARDWVRRTGSTGGETPVMLAGAWSLSRQPAHEVLHGCDDVSIRQSWLTWHGRRKSVFVTPETSEPEKERIVFRDTAVFVHWVDVGTGEMRREWVFGSAAFCLQHARDVDAGVYTCDGYGLARPE